MAPDGGKMTNIGWGVFDRVVARRQALVAARAAVDSAIDADPCERRCKCGMMAPLLQAEAEAEAKLAEAEESHRSFRAAFV